MPKPRKPASKRYRGPDRRSGVEKIRMNFTLHEENVRNKTSRPWIAPKDRSKTEYRAQSGLNNQLHTRHRRAFGVKNPLHQPDLVFIGPTVDPRGKTTYWYRDRRKQERIRNSLANPHLQVYFEHALKRGVPIMGYGQILFDFGIPRKNARAELEKWGRALGRKGNSLKKFVKTGLEQYDYQKASKQK